MLNDISLVWVAQNHENTAFWKWKDKFNRPEDTKSCEGYEARWDHHKEWLHTIENPLYFRL